MKCEYPIKVVLWYKWFRKWSGFQHCMAYQVVEPYRNAHANCRNTIFDRSIWMNANRYGRCGRSMDVIVIVFDWSTRSYEGLYSAVTTVGRSCTRESREWEENGIGTVPEQVYRMESYVYSRYFTTGSSERQMRMDRNQFHHIPRVLAICVRKIGCVWKSNERWAGHTHTLIFLLQNCNASCCCCCWPVNYKYVWSIGNTQQQKLVWRREPNQSTLTSHTHTHNPFRGCHCLCRLLFGTENDAAQHLLDGCSYTTTILAN